MDLNFNNEATYISGIINAESEQSEHYQFQE